MSVVLVRKLSTYPNKRDIPLTDITFNGSSVFILLSYSTNTEMNMVNEDKINRMYTLVKVGKLGGENRENKQCKFIPNCLLLLI